MIEALDRKLDEKHEAFENVLKETFSNGNYERQDETYFTRPIDELGRVVLPKEVREKYEIKDGQDRFEIYTKGNYIVLKKA